RPLDLRSFPTRRSSDLLDQSEHSCQFWWASRRPMWDVNMVHRGLMEQEEAVMNACRSVRLADCPEAVKDEYFYKFAATRDLGGRSEEHTSELQSRVDLV